MKIYFLSGLGADSRAFKYLNFPSSVELIYLDWLTPEHHESIQNYARRISKSIDSREPYFLIGLSFGGILAMEILEYVRPVKTILISSVCSRQQLPFYYLIAGKLKLNKLIPTKAVNSANSLTYWMFGVHKPVEKILLKQIITSSNTIFSKWAVNEIVNWKRTQVPNNIIKIHGDKDRILPINNFKPQHIIKGGGHLMVVTKAEEISNIIKMEIGFS